MSKATLNGTFLRCALASLLLAGCGGDGTGPKPPGAVASVEVSPGADTLLVGKNVQLSATVKDAAGNVLTDRTVTWSSADPTVVTVSSTGMVTAVSKGTAEITAAAEGQSAKAVIAVGGLFRDKLAVAYTGDAKIPIVAATTDGTRIGMFGGDGPSGVGGVVMTTPDGKSMTIFVDSMGLPNRAVIGDVVFLFANYTDNSVDIATLMPDGTIEINRGVALDPALLRAARRARSLAGGAQLSLVSASLGLPSLSTWLKIGGLATGIVGCGLGFAAAPVTLGASLLVEAACIGAFTDIVTTLTGEDEEYLLLSSAGDLGLAGDLVECAAQSRAACISALVEVSGRAFGAASDLLDSRKSDVERAEKELAKEGSESGPPDPSSDKNGWIAFEREGEIYIINPVDGDELSVTDYETEDPRSEPDWSPDGRKIVYATRNGLYTIMWNGTEKTSLGVDLGESPDWSPDGSEIVFSYCESQSSLCVINADGTGYRLLAMGKTPSGGEVEFYNDPSWSPDGRRIVFTASRDASHSAIFIINADGTGMTRLTNPGSKQLEGYFASPAWSPDGRKIVYTGGDGIYIMNADGTGVTAVPNTVYFENVSWSPDGSKLVAAGNGDIVIMNPDGTEQMRLTNTVAEERYPTWGTLHLRTGGHGYASRQGGG